ncbi:MAG: prolyl oligopeptidase family serine peptidase [Bryobacterales bacterium]|nr:prolyl oligopeptidase family serine peptidase [Bryobacterales bacterium]
MRYILLIVLFAGTSLAQEWEALVRALRPGDTRASSEAVLDEVQERARRSLAAIPHPRTPAEVERVRPILDHALRESLGFEKLPWPPKLNARTVGTLHYPGYRIEKIIWQSLPGVDVPAHLYLPTTLEARAPAILFYNGHWWGDSKTHPDFQAFCINMARLGFVVLSFDPFGQGERGQSPRDHRRIVTLLAGVSQQGIAEYETRCALEYLLSRPEVDAERIGMTGASGGGYNTWINTALDDRIKVAVPVVGTSEFYSQIEAVRPLDWYEGNEHCHFVAGLIRYANNHELLAMAAPRPVLILAASDDESFPAVGVREIVAYGRALYRSFDAAEKFAYFEDTTTGHGYQIKKREAAYGWFLKWLKGEGDGTPLAEAPTKTLPFDAAELRCFPKGKNHAAGPGIVAAVKGIAPGRREPWPKIDAEGCRIAVQDAPVQRLDLCGTPAFLLKPKGEPAGVLVALDDRGKEVLTEDPVVRAAMERGWSVCGIDPRGIGERAVKPMNWVAAVSLLLDDWYVRRQAADILTALRSFAGARVALYARGDNAGLAAAAALNDNPVAWFALRDTFLSFHAFLDRPKMLEASYELRKSDATRNAPYDREIPFHYVPFRAFERTDIAEMLSSSPGVVIRPINGDWEPMEKAAAQRLLPGGVRVVNEDEAGKAVGGLIDQ